MYILNPYLYMYIRINKYIYIYIAVCQRYRVYFVFICMCDRWQDGDVFEIYENYIYTFKEAKLQTEFSNVGKYRWSKAAISVSIYGTLRHEH